MCTIIKADYLLANVLADRASVSFDSLNKVRSAIESSCKDVVVDVSAPAVRWALDYYPNLFAWDHGQVVRADEAEAFLHSEHRDWVFTHSVPDDVHQRVCAVIEQTLT